MKHFLKITAGLSIAAFSIVGTASAQDFLFAQEEGLAKMKVQLAGSVMGPAVKGAPYSGEEVISSTQVLADGTNIHHENRTTVYRDSEGRMRRETPEQVTIMDPVAGTSYFLNPKTMTVQKAPVLANYRTFHYNADMAPGMAARTESTFAMTVNRDGETSMVVNGNPVDSKHVAEAIAKAKQHGEAVTIARDEAVTSVPGDKLVMEKMALEKMTAERMAGERGFAIASDRIDSHAKSEDLGKANIGGVAAEGTRTTSTIEQGAIGNDRPIQTVTERWYSRELQTVVSTKTVDPRMGDTTFQLLNIRRDEPAAYLFQIPAGYTMHPHP